MDRLPRPLVPMLTLTSYESEMSVAVNGLHICTLEEFPEGTKIEFANGDALRVKEPMHDILEVLLEECI